MAALLAAAALIAALRRFGATQPVEQYRVFLLLAAATLTGCWGLAFERLGSRSLPVLVGGLGLLVAVAWQPTVEGRGYLHAAIGWASLWLALGIAGRGRRWAGGLIALLLAVGLLEALYGLAQPLAGVPNPGGFFEGQRSATGSLVNPNHFGGLINLLLLLGLGVVWTVGRRSRRGAPRSERAAQLWLLLLACALMASATVLSRSRGAVLVLVATLALLVVLVAVRLRVRRGLRWPLAAAGVTSLAMAGLLLGTGLLGRQLELVLSAKARLAVYRDSLRMIADHPWLGIGPGLFEWRFRSYQTAAVDSHYYHAHNDYLEIVAEWGLPLALLFWAFVGWRWWRTAGVFVRSRDPWRQGVALGCCGALASLLLHGLIDFNLYIPSNLMIWSALLGLGWSLDLGSGRARPVAPTGPRRKVARLLVFVALPLALVAAGLRVGRQAGALRVAAGGGQAALERAARWDPTAPEYAFRLGLLARDSPADRNLERARTHLERAVALNPWSWQYWWELARLQELQGDLPAARRSLERAVAANPRDSRYRWRLANFHLRSGELGAALEQMRAAVSQDPSLAPVAVALLRKAGAPAAEVAGAWPAEPAARPDSSRRSRARRPPA